MEDNDLKNNISFRNLLKVKWSIEIAIMIVAVSAVIFCRWMDFITNDVTGSLLGAIIGYSMSNLKKLHD